MTNKDFHPDMFKPRAPYPNIRKAIEDATDLALAKMDNDEGNKLSRSILAYSVGIAIGLLVLAHCAPTYANECEDDICWESDGVYFYDDDGNKELVCYYTEQGEVCF